MGEKDTLYADEEKVGGGGVTRESALKIGAMGLVAAFMGSFPGRAKAGTIYPAPCKPGQGFTCSGATMTGCGGPGSGCGCATQYLGRKLQGTKSYCVDMNVCCESLNVCSNGQTDCPPGYTCSNTTCCGEPVCLPPCGSTSVPPAVCCLTPAGNSGGCTNCASGGNCEVGFTQCGCNGPIDGSYCFTTTENTAACVQDVYCADVPTCTSSSDCGVGSVCITSNGCTGCGSGGGVCAPLCSTGGATAPARKTGGLTASGRRV